jgi:hypothetical protein
MTENDKKAEAKACANRERQRRYRARHKALQAENARLQRELARLKSGRSDVSQETAACR